MMKKAFLSSAILSVLPALVFAQQLLTAPAPITSASGLVGLACKIAQWIFWFAIVVSVISVLYAAFLYLTSGGEEEKVRKAHAALTWIAVGVAVAVLAAGVPSIVNILVGGKGGVLPCGASQGGGQPTSGQPTTGQGSYDDYPFPVPGGPGQY